MESRGHKVVKASRKQDIYEHIDYFVNGKGFDVKGNRSLESIWLELDNVLGKKGWLRGSADYIAFRFNKLNQFMIFSTKDLLNFVTENVKEQGETNGEYMKFYTRRNRKDLIVRVSYDHIKHLKHQIIDCV